MFPARGDAAVCSCRLCSVQAVAGFCLSGTGAGATGGLTMALGVVLNLPPKVSFRRAGTTVNPLRPSASSVLVTSGLTAAHGIRCIWARRWFCWEPWCTCSI